jgi:hypothetical protein
MGFAAVPQLIEALDDERFSRSVSYWRRFCCSYHVLRVGDCAREILEEITGESFCESPSSDPWMVEAGRGAVIKKRAQAWWQDYQRKGERRMLIKSARAGNWTSARQAEKLAMKYPGEALEAICIGIHRAQHEWIRNDLVRCLGIVCDKRKKDVLLEEMRVSPYLSTQVAAACELLSQGCDEGLDRMIQKWNGFSLNEPLPGGWQDLAAALSATGRLKAIEALGRNLSKRPVEVRMEIARDLDPSWNRQRKFLKSEVTPAVQQGIYELLFGLLDDSEAGTTVLCGPDGRECRNPRVSDIASSTLSAIWGREELFDIYGPAKVRDSQRQRIKEIVISKFILQ